MALSSSGQSHGCETPAMLLTGAETAQPIAMRCGGVTLVPPEPVLRVDIVHCDHDVVPGRLRDDRRGAYRLDQGVTADDGFTGKCLATNADERHSVAIDQEAGGPHSEAQDGAPHCQ